ncbi:MAG: ParB/RepB/Spo0J family partition protein [Spongiibacteraceae bacterium]|nr:ParB/RepB/Spo0J family partition protein [Spongiibacteraceae bacterium]
MAKSKFSEVLGDISKTVQNSKKIETTQPLREENARSSPADSPMEQKLKRKAALEKADESNITQKKVIWLPVSKRQVPLSHLDLKPQDCFVSPQNPRVQALLTDNDPKIIALKVKIESEQQRDPILVRKTTNPESGDTRYEVIYGSRRLFVCTSLGINIRAWIGEIPNADVRSLAKSENHDRTDLSPWEKAKDLVYVKQEFYKGKSVGFIAEQEGYSRQTADDLLKLARLPEEYVAMMLSPDNISINSGCSLVSQLANLAVKEKSQLLVELQHHPKFTQGKDILKIVKKVMKSWIQSTPKKIAKNKKVQLINTSLQKVAVSAKPHRSEAGRFQLDLVDFNDDEIRDIVLMIGKIRKGYEVQES